jgi:DNA anti-recombination protein RmuC
MGLTDRSRLGSIKSRQKRIQRKLEKLNGSLGSSSTSTSQAVAASETELSAQKKAWEKYMFAKAVYEETKEMEHWRYMQKCISEYEKTLNTTKVV